MAISITSVSPGVGLVGWEAADAQASQFQEQVLRVVEGALSAGEFHRVEAEVPRDRPDLRRLLQRAGLRPEGVARDRFVDGEGSAQDAIRMARLAGDSAPGTRESFIAMLNATLPTKRVIAQGLIRNERGELLLCELVYKKEWDLPGGVVDPRESPQQTVIREIAEELAIDLDQEGLAPGLPRLAATNWLPPYRQWEDAVLLVFDLGVLPDVPERAILEPAEIRSVHWVAPRDLEHHVAPYAARHLAQILAADPTAGPLYLEDGQPS